MGSSFNGLSGSSFLHIQTNGGEFFPVKRCGHCAQNARPDWKNLHGKKTAAKPLDETPSNPIKI
jgi:hypothetical protein